MSTKGKRQLPCICRLYKNASGKILAIDKVSITLCQNSVTVPDIDNPGQIIQKFDVYVDTIKKSRTLLHLETGGSRIVSSIQMIGTYSSIEENSGNFFIVKYNASSPQQTDISISLAQVEVAKIGDTL